MNKSGKNGQMGKKRSLIDLVQKKIETPEIKKMIQEDKKLQREWAKSKEK